MSHYHHRNGVLMMASNRQEAKKTMKRKMTGFAAAAILLASSLVYADNTPMPEPGTVNYVEGQVSLQGQTITNKSIGQATLDANQVVATTEGNVELLLTPGVYLRLGHNSEARMISPGLADTKLELLQGTATVEVTQLFKENNLGIIINGSLTRITKHGLYVFSAVQPSVAVVDGQATVYNGRHPLFVHKGFQAQLTVNAPHKEKRFNKTQVETDPLYLWTKVRSQYESQANVDTARDVENAGSWYGSGWYWDPYWDFYSFLPGDGIMYSPFGWGFFSPGYVWAAPMGYYPYHGYGGAGGVGPGRNNPGATGRTGGRVGSVLARSGGSGRTLMRAPRSTARSGGFGGGGFRGGMGGGGFPGGGMGGGGFHGGGMARGR